MISALLDAVMERRTTRLLAQVQPWLPARGKVLDLGSGTGHVAARLENELSLDVVTADVTDIHVKGPAPIVVADGALPFAADAFATSLLFFMLAYPQEPARVLTEAARVTNGPVILVQSVYSGRVGRAWHRGREFFWTTLAFHTSKLVGYVSSSAEFTMRTRRFYTASTLEREIAAAGLRIRSRSDRSVLPGGALTVVALRLERDV